MTEKLGPAEAIERGSWFLFFKASFCTCQRLKGSSLHASNCGIQGHWSSPPPSLDNRTQVKEGPVDLSPSIKLLEDDIAVIDAGLAKLNSAAVA
jgi:hypothetical protein